ncbi:hypothetical protein E4U49_005108 [Claviceps purpurea]|nr:hypothetical protein E4U49_005108 [Claviceps purpurea]
MRKGRGKHASVSQTNTVKAIWVGMAKKSGTAPHLLNHGYCFHLIRKSHAIRRPYGSSREGVEHEWQRSHQGPGRMDMNFKKDHPKTKLNFGIKPYDSDGYELQERSS